MRFSIPQPGLLHVVCADQEDLCRTFMRIAEFYESPYTDVRGCKVSAALIEERHRRDHDGEFYCAAWHGFNVPGHAARAFFELYADVLTPQETLLAKVVRTADAGRPFYIIGTHREDEVRHETAHALLYLRPDYRDAALHLVARLWMQDPALCYALEKYLLDSGYDSSVLHDEFNAYLSSTSEEWWVGEDFGPEMAASLARAGKPFEALLDAELGTDSRLTVEVEGDSIVIRLPLACMRVAAENAAFIHQVDPDPDANTDVEGFRVVDTEAFAKEVVAVLCDESEDGTTAVHEMFDDAFERVVENGGEGYAWPAAGVTSACSLTSPRENQEGT